MVWIEGAPVAAYRTYTDGECLSLGELRLREKDRQRDFVAIATRVAGTLFHPKIVLE